MSELLEINTLDELMETIDENDKVLVEFGASWCGPCRSFLPHFTDFAEKHADFTCVKVDVDVDPEVVSTFKIMSVPRVALFEKGEFKNDVRGRTILQLERELAS